MADSVIFDSEEYVEQAYFFRALSERMGQAMASQEILESLREEVLATSKLPMALAFLSGELRLHGVMSPAMAKLSHYFTPFQTFVFAEAEEQGGQFDLIVGLEILRREAEYRARGATPQGIFLYQFESISRNRLNWDRGLTAMAGDPLFDEPWRQWIIQVRQQLGLIDLVDLIYVRSAYYEQQQAARGKTPEEPLPPVLFGEKEGRIALAMRHKDPSLLFASLHRQLGYPEVPVPKSVEEDQQRLDQVVRRLERLEARLKLVEEEQRGGIDLERFYEHPDTGSGGS